MVVAADGQQSLSGWGRTPVSTASVHSVGRSGVAAVVSRAGPRGALARGLGRSYGDAAQNAGGDVIRIIDDEIELDARTGLLRAAAGVSIDEILRRSVPLGWFVPVTPGTRYVTLGGAVAANVHGKNHHADGSFGAWVRSMRILLASGEVADVDPEHQPDLWWATLGGMGLTGVILEATVQMLPIETSRCLVDTVRARDLDELMAAMEDGDRRYRYSVAWVDLVARGAALGRGVLTSGDFATRDHLGADADPLEYGPRQLLSVPNGVPNVLNRVGVRLFNEAYFRRAPRRRTDELQTIAQFFHPLDAVGGWNRLYGPQGFLQYQFVVPFSEHATVRRVVERVVRSGSASFLAVLKRFGEGDRSLLGFPMPGWTLTLDVPAGERRLGGLLTDLDEMVLGAGGRLYLAKDAATTPEMIEATYPRLADFRRVRDRVDPDRRWSSDLSRRLGL